MTYVEALAYAEQMKAQHPTAHIPTPEELNANLFKNRHEGALRGTFNETGFDTDYRSSAPDCNSHAQVQWFDSGHQYYDDRSGRLSVRLVW